MKTKRSAFSVILVLSLIINILISPFAFTSPAMALTTLTATVIDDFEDGDASDWGFFGGNAAGGGGGALADRPQEGAFYLSTGWGGQGTASSFYGGAFKNFDNLAQPVPPAEPWFNVWVLNQSNATVDQYTLEITIREDLDGDGWTNGVEDSFRLDTLFTSASFNDEWMLVSAPLSSFADLSTGGDGTFNGNLDEVVIVIASVIGGDGSVVELDFDQFSFTSGGPVVSSLTVFDDMEHGDPFNNGWFAFGGSVGGGGIDANSADLPPSDGGAFSLQTGWGSGGTPGFFGGLGRTNFTDLTSTDHFNFWINPDAGQDYTLEINLQDDDTSDDLADAAVDDEFQYNCVVSATGPCAVSGGGWQQVSIPLADFFDDNSFFTGGNGVLDAVPSASGGNGQLVNIVVAVIGNSGSDATFRTDYWVFSDGPLAVASPTQLVDDFESGAAPGTACVGILLGFCTFSDGSPVSVSTTSTPPASVPDSAAGNNVLALTGDVTAFAGFIHGFTNTAVDTWIPQDWSFFEGLSFWLYGQNTGTTLFVDILDNRNPGSTTDDAERFTVSLIDDFSGWQFFEFPFSNFVHKEVGNGAPNDGFTLTQVHGWALGTLNTPGEVTYYVDDAALYGVAEIPELNVTFTSSRFEIEEGTTGNITVKLNRAMNSEDPAQVSVDYFTEPGVAFPFREYTPTSGTLTFINGSPSELSFPLETFDDTKWEGDERIVVRLTNPIDVVTGFATQSSAFITENDPYDSNLIDDFERFPDLWESSGNVTLSNPELTSSDPLARPGQDSFEGVLQVDGPIAVEITSPGNICNSGNGVIPITLISTDTFDATTVDHTTVTLGEASETHVNKKSGVVTRHEEDVDNDGDLDLIFHFRAGEMGFDCDTAVSPFNGQTFDGQPFAAGGSNATFSRDFAIGDDWTHAEALTFWYYGNNTDQDVTVHLKDNRAVDPGPSGWNLVWSEEFNETAGTVPNPENWTYEIGDVTPDGKNGWGNDELQYYTDDPANAATDGQGNMVLTVREDDGSRECYYGPCEYTSARLISWRKAEFAYGRIESRIKVPQGSGIWPAFWSLGTDIDLVSWPQTGEIDFMEFVGRLPNEVFGTIHGPGYSGGGSFGNTYTFDEPVFNDYHTFTVEWEPDLINWYVDGILYHTATPADVAPNEWVFNDPVFIILNVAIGGNFGGAVDPNIQMPQSMTVDYVRVYQGPDTAERFETTFIDDFSGWQQVEVPFTGFTRSEEQPTGAPNDGLNLNDVWGYGFTLPDSGTDTVWMDQVQLKLIPPPSALTVTTLADSGAGSLREALDLIAPEGIITFGPTLTDGTIALTSGQLAIDRSVTIDGSGAPNMTVSGNNVSRVFQVAAGKTVSMNDLTIADGVGAPQGGGILNYGTLNLDYVIVTNNTESSGGGAAFDLGGGGIYNGDGATLNLTNSTVSNNSTLGQPGGGIYGFFNSTINVTNSTVSGNVAGDVAGGFRILGNANIVDSTISGNTSTAWHGGAMFSTDGIVTIVNSSIIGNNAPGGTTGGLFVGTFGPSAATLTLQDSIVANNSDSGCFPGYFGAGTVTLTSLGGNIFTDNSCNPIGSDIVDPGYTP